MSRSKVLRKPRPIQPDPLYRSKLVTKLINYVMLDGNRSAACKIVYGSISNSMGMARSKYLESHPDKSSASDSDVVIWFLESIVNNIAPSLEIRTRRVGGSNYQIPFPVSHKRALSLSMRWLINCCTQCRRERGMMSKLTSEMSDAIQGRGEAMKKKEMIHKAAEANRAFAHYANMASR